MQAVLVGSNTRFSFKFILVIIMLFVCISGQFEGITHVFGQDFEDNLCISRAVIKRQGPGISPQQLSKENRRNIEPKETHSYLIPHLLVVFTQQHEILLTTRPMCHCSTSKQMKTITREAPGLGEVVRHELNKVYSFIHLFILFIIIYPF